MAKNVVSRWCIKKHARVGAMGVPIATPVVWGYMVLLKVK